MLNALKSLNQFYAEANKEAGKGAASGEDKRSEFVVRRAGEFLKSAALLGQRTAEMHVALASDASDPAFAPEPFTMEFQRALEESMRGLSTRVFAQLREKHFRIAVEPAGEGKARLNPRSGSHAEISRGVESADSSAHGREFMATIIWGRCYIPDPILSLSILKASPLGHWRSGVSSGRHCRMSRGCCDRFTMRRLLLC